MAEVARQPEGSFTTTDQAGVVMVETSPGLEMDLETRPEFERVMAEVVGNAACSAVVVDLSQATFMDVSNLQVLQQTRAALQSEGKALALDLTGKRNYSIQRLLEVTGLMNYFFTVTEPQPWVVHSNPRPERTGNTRRPRLRVIQGMGDAEAAS